MNRISTVLVGLAILIFALMACNNPPPPPTNQNPVAAFSSASPTIKAGDAVLFTSSSSDPDGDALTQSWDFGDDTRGGGSSIAHVFPSAGAFTVKLTVADGKGGLNSTSQSITVTGGEPLGAPLAVSGEITDTTGQPLAGVAVKLGETTLGASDASGKVMVSVPTGPSQTLMLFKEGYTDQVAALEFPIGSSAGNAFFKISMMPQAPSQPLSATTGGALTGEDNAKLEIPANGLETENGTPVTGNVEVNITPLDVSDPAVMAAMPGRLEGMQPDGTSAGIVSLGMTDFSLSQNGQDLNLKPGSSAKVRIPLYSDTDESGKLLVLGDTIPLWSLSEKTGEWVQEGIGTVVDTGNGIKALEATVTHFSLWNADKIYDENRQYPDPPNPPLPPLPEPKPKCKVPPEYDTALKQLLYCKFLAEMVEIFGEDGPDPNGRSLARPQATTPRQPAWREEAIIPINNTQSAKVPPNRDIRYTACVVLDNEELCGSQVRKLQRGETPDLEILMLPVQKENVVLPLDINRNIAGKRRELSFEVALIKEFAIQLERINGSTLNAQVELYRQASNNGLGGRVFSSELGQTPTNLIRYLPSGKYVLIITPSANSTGDLRVRINTQTNTNATWKPFYQVDKKIQYSSLTKPCFASASNATGQTVFGWSELKNSTLSLQVSRYNAAADSFEVATTLATNNSQEYRCQLAISSNGDAMIIWWLRGGNTTKDIFWSRRAANANAWSAPTLLATADANYLLKRPSELQLDANGNASLVWLEQHSQGTSSQLKTARYNPSTNLWTTSVLVAPMPSIKLSIPSLDSDGAGNQMVLYRNATQGANSAYPSNGYYVQKYDLASGVWLAPTLLKVTTAPNEDIFTNDRFSELQLRIGTGGHAVAVWQESADSFGSAKLNPSTGIWTSLPTFPAKDQAVDINAAGTATVVVYNNSSNLAGVGRYETRTLGATEATWSAPIKLLQNDAGNDSPVLAINPIGDTATTFRTITPKIGFQFTSRSSSSNTWRANTTVADSDTGAAIVSIDDAGQALLIRLVKQTQPDVSILEYQRVGVR